MIALFAAATLHGEPNAGSCSVAYAIEAQRRLVELGPSMPIVTSKLTSAQLDTIRVSELDHLINEGRTWTAIAFRRDETWAAMRPASAKMSASPDEQAATFASCSQMQTAALEPPFQEPTAPAPGAPDECGVEDAAVHAEIREQATADLIRAHALMAMSRIENGVLTCHSLDEARYVWMEIGAAAAAAVAKSINHPIAK